MNNQHFAFWHYAGKVLLALEIEILTHEKYLAKSDIIA